MHRRQPCHSSQHGKNSPSALFINYVEQHGGHFTVSIQTHQLNFLSLEEIPQHVGQRARPDPRSVSCHPATIQARRKFAQAPSVPSVRVGSGRQGHNSSQKWEANHSPAAVQLWSRGGGSLEISFAKLPHYPPSNSP